VGERNGRMGEMGKGGGWHRAHGTDSAGGRCEGSHPSLQLQHSFPP